MAERLSKSSVSEKLPRYTSDFFQNVERRWNNGYYVGVGLDPDPSQIPEFFSSKFISSEHAVLSFNKEIIDATGDVANSFKVNSAFYESLWESWFEVLSETIEYAKTKFPQVPVIDDAKRGDVEHTNRKYAESIFDQLGADAVTVHPYTGSEAMSPFLERDDKGVFVLCKTSDKGSGEFQDLELVNGEKLFEATARIVRDIWNRKGNVGLVVGATHPHDLKRVCEIAPNIPLLVPGIGRQGGEVERVMLAGEDRVRNGMIFCSSREIQFASNGVDFAEAAREKVVGINKKISGMYI